MIRRLLNVLVLLIDRLRGRVSMFVVRSIDYRTGRMVLSDGSEWHVHPQDARSLHAGMRLYARHR